MYVPRSLCVILGTSVGLCLSVRAFVVVLSAETFTVLFPDIVPFHRQRNSNSGDIHSLARRGCTSIDVQRHPTEANTSGGKAIDCGIRGDVFFHLSHIFQASQRL